MVGEDKWTKTIDLFDFWTAVAVNSFAELYLFWINKGVNICTPFEPQKKSLDVNSEDFDKTIKYQKELIGYGY